MAVLGIFMQSYADNEQSHLDKDARTRTEWEKYFNFMERLKTVHRPLVFDFNYKALMGDDPSDFWRYEGSLTTPPCSEGVIWTIFKRPIVFLENQFQILRDNIQFEDYRGPQPVYNRTVYRNFLNETCSSVPDYNKCLSDVRPMYLEQSSLTSALMQCSVRSIWFLLLFMYFVLTVSAAIFLRVRRSMRMKKYE